MVHSLSISYSSAYKGKLWCYVDDPRRSSCKDLIASGSFRGEYWSFHACATPAPWEYPCVIVPGAPAQIDQDDPPIAVYARRNGFQDQSERNGNEIAGEEGPQ